jgi:hypothetical protein
MNLLSSILKKKKEVKKPQKDTNSTKPKNDAQKVANRKGELGEYKIDIQLDQLPKEFKHLSDIQIKNTKAKSGYSQIDHIVISPYGIFVIETKNYQGTVYGDYDRKIWSVNGKFKMMNPFTQNYGHIQALKSFVDEEFHNHFISMVSFTKRCTFKIDDLTIRKIASDNLLVYDVELFDYIHRKVSVLKLENEQPILTEDDINMMYHAIEKANITDKSLRDEHVKSLQGKSNKVEKSVEVKQNTPEKCNTCQKPVSDKVKIYCLSNNRFEGKIYCFEHQKR